MLKRFSLILPICLSLTACFEKETSCHINGLAIDDSIIGLSREQVLAKLGNPRLANLGEKTFDDYGYTIDEKKFAVILHYEKREEQYYVSLYPKCIKADATLEISNHVIWH